MATDRNRNARPVEPDISCIEENILEILLNFHQRIRELIRQAPLSDDAKVTAYQQISSALAELETTIRDTPGIDLKERLAAIYEETVRSVADNQ